MCGNGTVGASIIAVGNRLRYPKRGFPAWVPKHEHDPLLWVSGTDGMSLARKINQGANFFLVVVVSKLGSAELLRAMSGLVLGSEQGNYQIPYPCQFACPGENRFRARGKQARKLAQRYP